MMIERLTPEIGCLRPELLDAVGASQLVITDGMVYWSGLVAAESTANGIEFPATDVAGQLAFVLEKLDTCLLAAGSDRTQIIGLTIYTTAIDELSVALGSIYAPWVGPHRPTVTSIGVARLSLAQTLVEVQGFTVCRSERSQDFLGDRRDKPH